MGWISTPPVTRTIDMTAPFLLLQGQGVACTTGTADVTRSSCYTNSTDVTPPDRCVPPTTTSSLPAGNVRFEIARPATYLATGPSAETIEGLVSDRSFLVRHPAIHDERSYEQQACPAKHGLN